MDLSDKELNELVAKGKAQGYLTYDEVNDYLPDEAVTPEKLDNLLTALDELGIELVTEPPAEALCLANDDAGNAAGFDAVLRDDGRAVDSEPTFTAEQLPKLSDDPVRMYLSQMAVIPLLTREEEISLAKKIEVTRKRFRAPCSAAISRCWARSTRSKRSLGAPCRSIARSRFRSPSG